MEKEVQRKKSSLKNDKKQRNLYEDAISNRPTKVDGDVKRDLSERLDQIASKMKISVIELLHKAEHSAEFKEEYLEARKLACHIALLKK